MGTGLFFTLEAVAYMIILCIIYFKKGIYNSEENKAYSLLVSIVVFELITEITLDFVGPMYQSIPLISYTVARLYCVLLTSWLTCLCLYIVIVALKMKNKEAEIKKYKKMLIGAFVFLIILICFLPINFFYENNIAYTYGPGVNIVYVGSFLFSSIGVVCMVWNYKNIKDKRFLPLVLFLTIGGICSIIQYLNPGLLLATVVHSIITYIMYHTIENPDMKLLDEVHKSKEISDAANEEKTLFLYNMTQEIRNTTKNINNSADEILDSDSIEENKDSARNIKAETSSFTTMTNDILDISQVDSANIKIYNTKYNIKTILKEVINVYNNICKNKNIEFRTNIDHSIPDTLYGDSIELKYVLTNVLKNSVNNTSKGYVEFSINTIIKNDLCRLIITIDDSSLGIKSEDLNEIKIKNKDLSEAYKKITLMNGTMIISSSYGIGTKIKIVLDQKIDNLESEEIKKYNEVYDNKEVLVVDDSEAGLKIIEKLLKGSNIKITMCNTAKSCLDKIKSKEKYDLILLDEQLEVLSAIEIMKKLATVRNFDIPVILLTKDTKYEYTEEYKNIGFANYVIKPIKKDDLLSKINEVLKKGN